MLKSRENVTYARQSTIVIIDDEPAVTSALARLLRGNVNVLTANSGPEALAILRTISSIDLVLLDISMPKYNSVDLLGDMSTMKSAPPNHFVHRSSIRSHGDGCGFCQLPQAQSSSPF